MLFHRQTSFLYNFLYCYTFLVLYYSKSIGKQEQIKIDCYLLKIKPYLCLFIVFQVHLGWALPCQGKVSSLGTTYYLLLWQDVVPKECYSWCCFGQLGQVTKTTNMVDSLEMHSPFRQKQTFCFIMKVLIGETVVADPELSTYFGWGLDWSQGIWPTTMQHLLLIHKYYLVQGHYNDSFVSTISHQLLKSMP